MIIKEYLKSVHITQKELADRLLLSRPTLDAYIQQYQIGQSLPKDKYQVIFEQLFSEPAKTEEQFWSILNEYSAFLKDEKALGTSEMRTEASYVLSLVTQEMKKDLFRSDSNRDIYVFINLLLHYYRRDPLLLAIVDYFLLLHNRKNLEQISEEEWILLSNLHALMRNRSELSFDKESFTDLVERTKKSKADKAAVKKILMARLIERVDLNLDKIDSAGIDINADDFDLMSLLK